MPKKFTGENSKAVVAKERKEAARIADVQQKKAQQEDELWRDDDKKVAKKQQKKEDVEKKKQEQLEKKALARALEEQELEQIRKESGAKQPASKLTRAQIVAENEKREAAARQSLGSSTPTKPEVESHLTTPLTENINRLVPEGAEARTVDEAIAVLSIDKGTPDKHPEKRMKAAYTAFEEKHMPRLKQENSNMRLSQIKQLLHKEWLKSPENPLNQQI